MNWSLASMVVLGLALAAGFAWWERSRPPSRLLALVATLAALAALGRIAFAPLPNVKPTTDIVLFAGYVLGGAPGFVVGAVAALASNVFFGQGPWTPWQMAAWGGVGVLGAALAAATRGRELGRVPLAVACGVAGLAFGVVMNVHLWMTYGGDLTLGRLAAYQVTSIPFDVAHAVGNVLFCLAFGPALVAALRRYRARLDVRWAPLPAAAASAALLLAVALAAGTAAPADAAVPKRSVQYLLRAQNSDGGFGGAPGQGSTGLHTGWTALGLAAAGRNPADVRRNGRSVLDHLEAHVGEVTDLGELERTVLVLAAAGRDPRSFGGRDLVGEVLSKQADDGSFARRVNTTSFAVLALRAAGRGPRSRPVRRAAAWIAREVNPDGGFNFAGRGGQSGVDDTGAAVQALVAAGRRGRLVRRAARFLIRAQNADGGFPLTAAGPSNAQSTAWAVQGLVAAGRDPARVRRDGSRTPFGYLKSLTARSGAVRYSRTSTQTPVWVTGQAITALARKPFPLAPVARARRPVRARSKPAAPPAPAAPTAPTATPAPAPRAEAADPAPARARGGGRTRPALAPAAAAAVLSEAEAARAARSAGAVAGAATAVLL